MARSLRAFVSYRRNDNFVQAARPGGPDFIGQLSLALKRLGFTKIFVDTADIEAGDYFEGRIHRAILNCDLFIPLIGTEWLRLLNEKAQDDEPDILEREIATAFALEKDIVPLLVDGAPMPQADQLPERIRQLAGIDANTLASNSPADSIVAALEAPVREISGVHRLGSGWTGGYLLFAFAVWVMCAIVPNIVGFLEFGYDPWIGMATGWAGMFIWPLFFLPFILLALRRPLQILWEATLNADSPRDKLVYVSPILGGAILALFMTASEISPPQVPWTIHPQLAKHCSGPLDPGPGAPESAAQEYDRNRQTLTSYEIASFRDYFWMKDKCWPNVFFYLTVPLRGGPIDGDYTVKRPEVQKAFLHMIGKESRGIKGTDAPFSYLPAYRLTFGIQG